MKNLSKMLVKSVQNLLESALIGDQAMSDALLSENLIEHKDEFSKSLEEDNEDVIFAIDQHENSIAMLLIEKNGDFYVNTDAKDRLKFYWQYNYENNLKKFIPFMANQLKAGKFAVLGFTIEDRFLA
ncbi:MAG: hypothetical protein ACR65R_17290 [Methylomicrobium sp.]